MLEKILWPVTELPPPYCRPVRLIDGLRQLGAISATAQIEFSSLRHRSVSVERRLRIHSFVTTATMDAVLTPLAPPRCIISARWLDLYDDWSLAPDISLIGRGCASLNYHVAHRRDSRRAITTVNSRYLLDRFWDVGARLVPNGVDEEFGEAVHVGDDSPKLLIMGSLLRRRVDVTLLLALLACEEFDEILVADDGPCGRMLRGMQKEGNISSRIRVMNRVSWHNLLSWIGSCTVAAIPHNVSDYTISQDPMKLYQYLAYGLPVIMPRSLWPKHLPIERGFLVERGTSLERIVHAALRAGVATDDWRRKFSAENCWTRRAEIVAEELAVRPDES